MRLGGRLAAVAVFTIGLAPQSALAAAPPVTTYDTTAYRYDASGSFVAVTTTAKARNDTT